MAWAPVTWMGKVRPLVGASAASASRRLAETGKDPWAPRPSQVMRQVVAFVFVAGKPATRGSSTKCPSFVSK